jgi:transcriptional regulator NrdR family protein
MICPKCGKDNNFVRTTEDNFYEKQIIRIRFCKTCAHMYQTMETAITNETYNKIKKEQQNEKRT